MCNFERWSKTTSTLQVVHIVYMVYREKGYTKVYTPVKRCRRPFHYSLASQY